MGDGVGRVGMGEVREEEEGKVEEVGDEKERMSYVW